MHGTTVEKKKTSYRILWYYPAVWWQ